MRPTVSDTADYLITARALMAEQKEDEVPEVDDTDGLDPVAEFEAWRLRELARIKRDKEAEVARELEREEIELVSTPFEDKKYYENIRRALCAGFFMQVAKKDTSGKNYSTVKDNQSVLLHPSTVLGQDSEWVLYNEFVLTSKNYIRTVTAVKPEWLLDIAPMYYDLDSLPKGDVKTALQRTADRMKRREAVSKGKR